jgi:hypothetical protein
LYPLYFLAFFFVFILNSIYSIDLLLLNIFRCYLYTSSLYNTFIHYLFWAFIGYLLIEKNCKRLEI